MTANENGRAATEVTTPPDATGIVQDATTAHPQDNYPRPMGASPLFAEVTYLDARDLMTEPADMGDALALEYAPLDALNVELWRAFFAARGIAL